jgi:hypothetical protein
MIGRASSSANFLSISHTNPPALLLVGLARLLLDQLVDLSIAVTVVICFRTANVILIEGLVRIVDAFAGKIETN